MTKLAEKELLEKVNYLENKISELYAIIYVNKIDKHIYSVKETAQILGKTPQAVYSMIERGELKTTKLGHIKVLGDDLRKILSGNV